MKKLQEESTQEQLILQTLEATSDIITPIDSFLSIDNRNIVLNGSIDDSIIESVYIPLKVYEADDKDKPVNFYINSCGGDFYTSFFIVDLIEKYKKPLNIIGLGYCYSSAFMLLIAGKNNPNVTRMCYDKTSGLIHAGSYSINRDIPKIFDAIRLEEKMQETTKNFFLSNSNVSPEEYKAHYKDDWYFTADEMLEKELVDKII